MAAAELDFIFDSSLISPEIQADYPAGYTIRPLARDDYKRGFLQCLQALTFTGDISEAQYLDRFDWHKNHGQGWYYCVVIVEDATDRIVGTGTVVVEKKFIHNLGISGHIEDISIAKDHQGKHFGQKLIKTLDSIAVSVGCYKSILNCSLAKAGFYAKCGYKVQSLEMSHLYEETRAAFEEAKSAYERKKCRALRKRKHVELLLRPQGSGPISLTIPFAFVNQDFRHFTDILLPPTVEFLAVDDYYCDALTRKVLEFPIFESRLLGSKQLQDRFSNLKALTIYRTKSEKRHKELCRMIHSCDLRYFHFEDDSLEEPLTLIEFKKLIVGLRRQQNLEALILKRTPFSFREEQLGNSPWPKLKALYLENADRTWLEQFPKFENLQMLSLQHNTDGCSQHIIDYQATEKIAECRNLQALDISFRHFGFDDPTGVKGLLRIAHGCTLLRKLSAQHLCFEDHLELKDTTTFSSLICALPHLEILDLNWRFQIKGAWVQDLALHCPRLTVLKVHKARLQISIAQLKKTLPLQKLEIMQFQRINFDNPGQQMEPGNLGTLVSEWRRVFPRLRDMPCPPDRLHMASVYLQDINFFRSKGVKEAQEMSLSESENTEESSSEEEELEEEEEDDLGYIPSVPQDEDDSLPLRLKLWTAIDYGRDLDLLTQISLRSIDVKVVDEWQKSFEIETFGWPVLPFDAFTDAYQL